MRVSLTFVDECTLDNACILIGRGEAANRRQAITSSNDDAAHMRHQDPKDYMNYQ